MLKTDASGNPHRRTVARGKACPSPDRRGSSPLRVDAAGNPRDPAGDSSGRYGRHRRRERHAREGIVRRDPTRLVEILIAENLGRLEWSVLDWNQSAIDFYRAQGAKFMDDWTICRVSDTALWRLADHAR